MRSVSIVAVLIAIFAVGCGESNSGKSELKWVEKAKLQKRLDGLQYEVNSEEPFTGMMFESYRNGKMEKAVEFRDGRGNGNMFFWHKNGQMRIAKDNRDGKSYTTFWHENGQKLMENVYRDGKEISSNFWDEQGNRIATK